VGYRLAIGSLALILALGLCPLLRVPDVRYEETVDEFTPEGRGVGRFLRNVRRRRLYLEPLERWPFLDLPRGLLDALAASESAFTRAVGKIDH
jgi:hypothetical protein